MNRCGDHGKWQAAVNQMKVTRGELADARDHLERASLYDNLAALHDEAFRHVDLDLVPDMLPEDGPGYLPVYAASAMYLRLLARGERHFGRYVPGTADLTGLPRAEQGLWEAYLASADRLDRAELLIRLARLIEDRSGFEIASEINAAVHEERQAAGFPVPALI